MNNIYDVVLNFNKYYYEVYEWKSSDEIENIRKIPFFKVSDKVFVIIRDNDVKISKDVLSKLRSYYTFFFFFILEIKCLITNCKSCMGIIIDKEGYITKRSSMLYDEEEEVLEEPEEIPEDETEPEEIEELEEDPVYPEEETGIEEISVEEYADFAAFDADEDQIEENLVVM